MTATTITQAEVEVCEARLKEAMLRSNVELLDELLSPDLVFTTHLGQVISKQDDLAVHKSGTLKLTVLELTERRIQCLGSSAIVTVRAKIEGTFGGARADGLFRFLRVWARAADGKPQVVAGQATLVST